MIGNYWESSNTEGTQKSKNVKVSFFFVCPIQTPLRDPFTLYFASRKAAWWMGEIILVDVKDALSSRLWNLKAPYTQFEMMHT